jgi:hypothetical protein
MTAVRRLAAIMAIDVVGYSRLMGGDGEGGALEAAQSISLNANYGFPQPHLHRHDLQ